MSADERDPYFVLEFCKGAIRDAITLEDGLDGDTANAVLTMIDASLAAREEMPCAAPLAYGVKIVGGSDACAICGCERLQHGWGKCVGTVTFGLFDLGERQCSCTHFVPTFKDGAA